MLTDSELEAMRATVVDSLPDEAVIQSQAASSDSGGGATVAWTDLGTVACRIAPLTGSEGEQGDRIVAESRWVMTLPHGTDLGTDHRVLYSGGTFHVSAVRDRSFATGVRAELVKVS